MHSEFAGDTQLGDNTIYSRVGLPSRGPGQARGLGQQEPYEIQPVPMSSPAQEKEEPLAVVQKCSGVAREQVCGKGPGAWWDQQQLTASWAV